MLCVSLLCLLLLSLTNTLLGLFSSFSLTSSQKQPGALEEFSLLRLIFSTVQTDFNFCRMACKVFCGIKLKKQSFDTTTPELAINQHNELYERGGENLVEFMAAKCILVRLMYNISSYAMASGSSGVGKAK